MAVAFEKRVMSYGDYPDFACCSISNGDYTIKMPNGFVLMA